MQLEACIAAHFPTPPVRATTRLDVAITNEALAARSCVVGEPCISLDGDPSTSGAALWAGSDNRIVEIGRTEDSMVLAIEVSQQFQGPFSRLAAQVVSTAYPNIGFRFASGESSASSLMSIFANGAPATRSIS